jgi:hypothetical protein
MSRGALGLLEAAIDDGVVGLVEQEKLELGGRQRLHALGGDTVDLSPQDGAGRMRHGLMRVVVENVGEDEGGRL